MTYEELYGAHVVHKSKVFAEVYSTLQNMIKARTKAGYINGVTYIEVPQKFATIMRYIDTPCIKVKVWPVKGRYSDRLYISFVTKR